MMTNIDLDSKMYYKLVDNLFKIGFKIVSEGQEVVLFSDGKYKLRLE